MAVFSTNHPVMTEFSWYAKSVVSRTKVQIVDSENFLNPASADFYLKDTSSKVVTTRSKPSAFPSALRSKRSAVQTLTAEDIQTTATIRQTCQECGREEMRYYTLQLRSADEGSTVFYSCECGHKYRNPAYLILLFWWC